MLSDATAVVDRCVQNNVEHHGVILSDPDRTEDMIQGLADTQEEGQGRQRGPATSTPPTSHSRPTKTPQTPPLPNDDGSPTETTQATPDNGIPHRNGTAHGIMAKTTTKASNDAQLPTFLQGREEDYLIQEEALDKKERKSTTHTKGTCSCCTKTTDRLTMCDPCGQFFHPGCIDFNDTQHVMICRQCVEDQLLIGPWSENKNGIETGDTDDSSASTQMKDMMEDKQAEHAKMAKSAKLPTEDHNTEIAATEGKGSSQMSISSQDSHELESDGTGGSSYIQTPPRTVKRKVTSKLKTPNKYSKLSKKQSMTPDNTATKTQRKPK